MNYQIILDLPVLEDFVQNVLPDHTNEEMFYCCLFARKKYCPEGVRHVKSDKAQLKRFTASKDRLITKIRQLECPVGSYIQDNSDQPIPQEALALYISINPRNLYKATLKSLSKLASMVECDNRNSNPQAEVMSVIQSTCSRKEFICFDIDEKNPDHLITVSESLGGFSECYKVLETRGGYHILVRPDKVPEFCRKTFYREIAKLSDVTGDAMIPVPGTSQGGFMPKFLS